MPVASEPNIVICGVGGSGTRAVVHLLQETSPRGQLSDRNQAEDSLAATLLFKHRQSLEAGTLGFESSWRILQDVLEGRGLGGVSVPFRLGRLALMRRPHHSRRWYLMRAGRLIREAAALKDQRPWILKEPNLQMFADRILESREDVVVLVIARNGLDMAFSRNQQQVVTWGGGQMTPAASLEHWCQSHERLLDVRERFPDRMAFLRFEELCLHPAEAVQPLGRILQSIDMRQLADRASQIFKPPASLGRHLAEDLSQVPDALRRSAAEILDRVSRTTAGDGLS